MITMENIKTIAIYCRVSHDEQVKFGVSLDAQKNKLREYAKNNGHKIYNEYIDEGISASTIKKRPALTRLLNDLDKFNLVIFTKLDRFTRNVLDANNLIEIFDKANCAFKAIDEDDTDISTADGRFIFNLKVNIAERERLKTGERIRAVNEFKVKEGTLLTGSLPLGYKNVNKRMVIDDEKAEIVKLAFKLYGQNHSKRKTMIEVREQTGYVFNIETITKTLKNKLYIGHYRDNENYCPKIIDKSDFNTIQGILSKNVKRPASGRIYLFTSLLKCSACNHTITANYHHHIYYRCHYQRHIKNCPSDNKSIREEIIEEYLLNNLKIELKNYITKLENESKTNKKKLPKVIKEKPAIEKRLTKLKDLYINDLIQIDDYKKEYKILTDQLAKIEKYKSEIDTPKDIKQYKDLLKIDLVSVYNNLSREKKKEFWLSVIKKVVINSKENMDIYFNV